MEKKLYLLFTLTLTCRWVGSAPNRLDELKFDQLSFDESYGTKEDLDDFFKSLDDAGSSDNVDKSNTNNSLPKSKYSGFKNKYLDNKKVDSKHNIKELKQFLKLGSFHDKGDYGNDAAYVLGQDIAGKAIGINGEEDRKYKKGTKTRGFHRVQHKDEYKKDKEFYEDDETNGFIKKIGARGRVVGVDAGVGQSKYHFHNDRDKGLTGKQSYLEKGNSDKQYSENMDSEGFDAYFDTK